MYFKRILSYQKLVSGESRFKRYECYLGLKRALHGLDNAVFTISQTHCFCISKGFVILYWCWLSYIKRDFALRYWHLKVQKSLNVCHKLN